MDIIDKVSDSIIEASTNLSQDKRHALESAIENEVNENARWALKQILENYEVSQKSKFPLCDDTGIPHVIIELGKNREITSELISQINEGIYQGLNRLPARPMAVKGNSIERIEQSQGLFDDPGLMKPASFLIDNSQNPDTLNVHFLLQGGGPEIRAKTYRVYHKRSFDTVINEAIEWLKESLKLLGCTPSIPAIGIGRTHYEASSLMLKSMVYGNLDLQSKEEKYVSHKLNETNIGPLGFGGNTTVLGTFIKIGNQRASGVRIVSVRPSCFVEPRKSTVRL
ncbi:fumarate hydratase [Methanobrevibacter millerae]|uniref:Fumarate hydratase subunit alpha n=1 Tax=Methanobrevibacter millerae TaxID=230361 RepID=A0A1G5W008_9EURY|nr:fumarate hydratase [Methanobrevibacter millerae]SDA50535.1 fumarate hydratase subunit alpha [Methanobrevibacter millerae]